MYLAELHGKLSVDREDKEDLLTSNVFSFFKYADRVIFLRRFLRSIGIEVDTQAAQQAEFVFWPSYPDGTQPDLVLLVDPYYLLIEAKLHSGFGEETQNRKHQLIREIEGGSAAAVLMGKVFKLITVTAQYCYDPLDFAGIPAHYRRDMIWINWQKIALFMDLILNEQPSISDETRLFAEDLYRLLLKKGLRNYEGPSVLAQAAGLTKPQGSIFFQAGTARYRGDFIGFSQAMQDQPALAACPTPIFLKPVRKRWNNFPEPQLSANQTGHLFFRGETKNG